MARNARLTVTLSAASTSVVTVNYATVDGTAVSPSDYTHVSGTLTFAPGQVTKYIDVAIRDDLLGSASEQFSVVLSSPTGATILDNTGDVVLGSGVGEIPEYYRRFNWVYDKVHNTSIGYFGPQTGPNAFSVPRHIPEVDSRIINEAPDYGGETVSETASFWVGLEAWKGLVSGDWSGYNTCANNIEKFYIPNNANQPVGAYTASRPADYVPEGNLVSDYPRLANLAAPIGADPLYDELLSTYSTKNIYLMHWIIDVEGAYGFKNAELGASQLSFMNTYQRGMQESSYETIPQGAWNNWQNGGRAGSGGYDPLFNQGLPDYPAAPYAYSKKWSYTNAPDAEMRAIQWAFHAKKFATEQNKLSSISSSQEKYIKMGDYARYNLFDKYFRKIGDNQVAGSGYNSCHYLINWYASWGGEIPTSGLGSWSYRIGCGESHQGYQALISAYAMATGGGGMTPMSPSAGDIWLGSVYRQIEMIRWLQSPEGPIASGVTNSYAGDYRIPDGNRNVSKFYGMSYVYSPVWHDPPSNNWVGFQYWGQGRTADLFLEVSDKTTPLATAIRPNLEIILDRLVSWAIRETSILTASDVKVSFKVPATISWIVDNTKAEWAAEIAAGQGIPTTNNFEGSKEWLPTLNWDGKGDYAAFWNASTVPNPHLHCQMAPENEGGHGQDVGVAASMAYLLIAYAKAKKNMGKFNTTVSIVVGSTTYEHTAERAFLLAKDLLDIIWNHFRSPSIGTDIESSYGIGLSEPRSDYARMTDTVYVPTTPVAYTGAMPNGDVINSSSTFISIRSFLKDDKKWAECLAYANAMKANPNQTAVPPPNMLYHRFWAQVEFAMSCAALQYNFSELL
jgi:hypothetical protein